MLSKRKMNLRPARLKVDVEVARISTMLLLMLKTMRKQIKEMMIVSKKLRKLILWKF